MKTNDAALLKIKYDVLREVAKLPVPAEVVKAAQVDHLEYGREYLIPKPMDSRLRNTVSGAVARAAVASGVNQIPLPEKYKI